MSWQGLSLSQSVQLQTDMASNVDRVLRKKSENAFSRMECHAIHDVLKMKGSKGTAGYLPS